MRRRVEPLVRLADEARKNFAQVDEHNRSAERRADDAAEHNVAVVMLVVADARRRHAPGGGKEENVKYVKNWQAVEEAASQSKLRIGL